MRQHCVGWGLRRTVTDDDVGRVGHHNLGCAQAVGAIKPELRDGSQSTNENSLRDVRHCRDVYTTGEDEKTLGRSIIGILLPRDGLQQTRVRAELRVSGTHPV